MAPKATAPVPALAKQKLPVHYSFTLHLNMKLGQFGNRLGTTRLRASAGPYDTYDTRDPQHSDLTPYESKAGAESDNSAFATLTSLSWILYIVPDIAAMDSSSRIG